MKYKPGQTVRINKDVLDKSLRYEAERLNSPYVATIKYIQVDPHTGKDMYMLEGAISGWYENEILGIYVKEEKKSYTRYEIMDFED
jgi:hypothetical protein